MPPLKNFDFYRKIPLDLTETTLQGAVLSGCALLFMIILFACELMAFLTPEVYSTVAIDSNRDTKLRINFNLTMPSLPCEYASVDVLDVLGTNRQNVTKNIVKWHTDSAGNRVEFHGRNKEQEDIHHEHHHRDLALAHEDGEHALPLDYTNFDTFLEGNDFTIVDFYAPWCIWCQRLAPTWEAFAERAQDELPQLRVVKVDCVVSRDLCHNYKIHAFPTIRLFKRKEPDPSDYRKDRSLEAFMEYSVAHVGGDEQTLKKFNRAAANHPGCQLSGFLMVNRVPGNFHIEAQSKHQNINGAMTNVSHTVNYLSFGSPHHPGWARSSRDAELQGVSTIENETFVTDALHQAPHHYLKVVSTFLGKEWSWKQDRDVLQYQMIISSQMMPYEEGAVPEAKFSYDLSPMCVHVKQRTRKWYDFITSVMAIVGGTFTVVGVIDSIAFRIFKQKKL